MDGLGIPILGGLASLLACFLCLLVTRLRRYAFAALVSPFASSLVFLIGMFLLADMNPAAEYDPSYKPPNGHEPTTGHIVFWLGSVAVTFLVSGLVAVKIQQVLHKVLRRFLA